MKMACAFAICLVVLSAGRGTCAEIDDARQEYESVLRELTAAVREREAAPEMERLRREREEAQSALEHAALRIPELMALDGQKKALDAKLVPLRERRRAEEQAAAKTGSPEQAGQSIPNATLRHINDEIARLEGDRRQVKAQIEQTAMALPALEAPRKALEEIEQAMKRFLADEPPPMKELRVRSAAAQSRWHKLRVEQDAARRGETKTPAEH